MSDLISRQAAIKAVHKSIFDFFDICDDNEETPMTQKDELLLEINKAITTQIKAVVSAQPIEAEPIKHGRWEQVEVVHDRKDAKIQDWQQAKCSVCGKWHTTPYMYYLKLDDYCPNCGAKMDEVEE